VSEPILYFNGDFRFLSNFYPAEVQDNFGIHYPTVEHAYQAAKCDDPQVRKIIAALASPGLAKRSGKQLQISPVWDEVKFFVMRSFLDQKFSPGSELALKLKSTGDRLLIEGNHWGDTIWGQCPIGHGANHLGKMLMDIRSKL
jgi:ribA/ribD-fused uncharacterized protein